MTEEKGGPFPCWAILELMGHRRLAGMVTEQEVAGHGFIRIDVPARDGKDLIATQFYSPGSVYCMTPTTEEIARRVAASCQPEPVHRWELPEPERRPADMPLEDDGFP